MRFTLTKENIADFFIQNRVIISAIRIGHIALVSPGITTIEIIEVYEE
jgi:hypothetical protein